MLGKRIGYWVVCRGPNLVPYPFRAAYRLSIFSFFVFVGIVNSSYCYPCRSFIEWKWVEVKLLGLVFGCFIELADQFRSWKLGLVHVETTKNCLRAQTEEKETMNKTQPMIYIQQ